jgi:hypothetical protein
VRISRSTRYRVLNCWMMISTDGEVERAGMARREMLERKPAREAEAMVAVRIMRSGLIFEEDGMLRV